MPPSIDDTALRRHRCSTTVAPRARSPSPAAAGSSYGTLRQRDVQLATFGREVDGRPDAIVGFELVLVTITDPHVTETSGSERHPILKPTDCANAAVEGTVFAISATELAAADACEVDDYVRVAVLLRSGGQAWVHAYGLSRRHH